MYLAKESTDRQLSCGVLYSLLCMYVYIPSVTVPHRLALAWQQSLSPSRPRLSPPRVTTGIKMTIYGLPMTKPTLSRCVVLT